MKRVFKELEVVAFSFHIQVYFQTEEKTSQGKSYYTALCSLMIMLIY